MSELHNAVLEIVRNNWKNRNRATLLNYLGSALGKRFDLAAELRGAKLLPYLKYNLGAELDIVQKPDDPLIWGAFPKGVLSGQNAPDLVEAFGSGAYERQHQNAAQSINFHRTIWAAFSKPLPIGSQRAVKLDEPKQFLDYPSDSAVLPEYLPIADFAGHLRNTDRSVRDVEIVRTAILDWVKANNIDISKVMYEGFQRKNRSILHSMIEALSDDDLKSVVIPLSVVKKLMEK